MADAADIANDIIQERLQLTLGNRPVPINAPPSAFNCEDCGSQIAEGRRNALPGIQTCIHCQEINEQRLKFHH
jgi:phage/conjugal plasmid C-4 type zinc finger TraR family protein